MRRNLSIVLFVLTLALTGFVRESFFVNLNALLYYKYYAGGASENISSAYQWLVPFSYQTLYITKWFATGFFAVAFWFAQKKFLHVLFAEKKAGLWLGVLYLSLLLLAGISFAAGWAFGNLDTGYRFSRMFMGLLQSPVPCMLIIPLTYFYKQNEKQV